MNISNKLPQLIGLAGSFASGKDTIAHKLAENFGYHTVSTSDILRSVAMKERGSIERPVLYEVANEHRHRDGPAVFVKLALGEPQPLIVTGLRSLGEAKAIREAGGIILFIDAPIEIRYKRMKDRQRDQEVQLSLEEFKANEQKEWHIGDGDADFNIGGIKKMADVVIDNVVPLDEFIDEVYEHLRIAIA